MGCAVWGGARISGTGPEKSFPVIRERVEMSGTKGELGKGD